MSYTHPNPPIHMAELRHRLTRALATLDALPSPLNTLLSEAYAKDDLEPPEWWTDFTDECDELHDALEQARMGGIIEAGFSTTPRGDD